MKHRYFTTAKPIATGAAGVLAALLALAMVQFAFAHAHVHDVEWDNNVNPTQVIGTATEDIAPIPGTYYLKVYDAGNVQVDLGNTTLTGPKELTVSVIPGLPDGVYRVDWATVSLEDGEADSGSEYLTLATPVGGTVALTVGNSGTATTTWLPFALAGAALAVVLAGSGLAFMKRVLDN